MPQHGSRLREQMNDEAGQISSEHHDIEALRVGVATEMADGTWEEARAAFGRFEAALAAHMAREEGDWFPALRRLQRGLGTELASLEKEHAALREEVRAIQKRLEAREREAASRRFDELVAALAAHDGREERLLGRALGAANERGGPGQRSA